MEVYNFLSLHSQVRDEDSARKFLQDRGILRKKYSCKKCGEVMSKEIKRRNFVFFRCSNCHVEESLRKRSFLFNKVFNINLLSDVVFSHSVLVNDIFRVSSWSLSCSLSTCFVTCNSLHLDKSRTRWLFFSFFGNNALATNVKGQYLGEEGWHRPGRRGQWVVEDDHCVLPFPV